MHFKTLLSAASLGLLLAGCKDQGFKKTKGGMPYKIISQSGAPKVKLNEWLKVHYTLSVNTGGKDSVLQSTWDQGQPYYMPVTAQSNPYDISELIPLLHKGDSVIAVQSMDTFMRRTPQAVPPFFKKGGKINYRIKVLDVFATQEAAREDEAKSRDEAFRNDKKLQGKIREDQQRIQQILAQSGAQAQQTPSGAFVQILSSGTGAKADKGSYVDVYYTGRTLNGTAFDSNVDTSFHHPQPLSFQVGKGQMLRGFDEAVQMMKQGDKGRIYLPSPLAYGENPPPGSKIGPNEILTFDVELRSVSMQDPRAGMQSAPPVGNPQGH
ncbi:FKBP-type peptidyl-prolyl cis-trans isomerase [Flaviaesturariibacter terrae]